MAKKKATFFSKPDPYGAELISNGNFNEGSTGWSLAGQFTISNGVGNLLSDGTFSTIKQSNGLGGLTCLLSYDIVEYISGNLQLEQTSFGTVNIPITLGHNEIEVTFLNSFCSFKRSGADVNMKIDNISVKEIL